MDYIAPARRSYEILNGSQMAFTVVVIIGEVDRMCVNSVYIIWGTNCWMPWADVAVKVSFASQRQMVRVMRQISNQRKEFGSEKSTVTRVI